MITPDPSSSSGGALRVPLSALAIDGTPPAAGDQAEVSATVRIVSAEGDAASVEIVSINGEPVGAASAPEPTDSDIEAAATEADKRA
ncbi:hypothetical protein OpiT1DRAFT_05301 [Opitutaceae bacterium TAV1]|nr:hypothetical protein OpiT1DRAFT_05301 [Opitutaceae bacterium TAV1]